MVKVNGVLFDIPQKTVSEYLAETNYDPDRVAIELNGSILPRSEYGKTLLSSGDILEIVGFVGGG